MPTTPPPTPTTCVPRPHAAAALALRGAAALAFAATALAGCGDAGDGAPGAAERRTVTVTRTVTERVAPPPARPAAPRPRPRPRPLALRTAASTHFTVRVPGAWTQVAADEDRGGFLRSQWRDPQHEETSVLVDVVPGETTAPADKAAEIRAATRATPGYAELGFGAVTLGGRPAVRWSFDVSGDRRVDWLLNDCGTGFAVLGSTSPGRFARLRPTFERVARSLEATCAGEQDPAPVPAGEDRDCVEFAWQPAAQAYFEAMGGSRLNDVDGLDSDHDGVACEWLPGGG